MLEDSSHPRSEYDWFMIEDVSIADFVQNLVTFDGLLLYGIDELLLET